MISQQVRTLLEPPSIEESNSKTISLLNSHFGSLDDLVELDSLVAQANEQNDDLKTNLSLSRSKIDSLLIETQSLATIQLRTAQELSIVRHSLKDDLSDLSQDFVSAMFDGERKSTLLEDLDTLHRNLKESQSIKGYVQIMQHALHLSEASVQQIRTVESSITSTSLGQYQLLQGFVSRVSDACAGLENDLEEQTLHLVSFLNKVRDKTWIDIKNTLSKILTDAAEKIGWPMPVDYLSTSSEAQQYFEKAFLNLLKLQNLGENIQPNLTAHVRKNGLYPLEALVLPVSLRFKYHFEGNRLTNRLDKPEWYFTHILNVAHEHRPFMESIIQKLLTSSDYSHLNAWVEFTLQLLPLLSRKLKHTIPTLLPHPPLLAHTIYQALSFDAALFEEGFQLLGTSATLTDQGGTWVGISEAILGNLEWFEVWLVAEKKFAENQYHEIISATDAWLIADDEDNHDLPGVSVKSTNSARRIKALIEQVTDRYLPLPNFNQKARFLLSIQLPLLENYYERVVSSLDAFETLSSTFVRAVPGALNVSLSGKDEGSVHVDTKQLTSGVEGVQRLCKALLSARFIEASMKSWGEEIIFLELWAEIKRKPMLQSRVAAHHLLPDADSAGPGVHEDIIFDEMIAQYRRLGARAEDMIVHQVCSEIESGLKSHLGSTSLMNSGPSDDISLSQTLLAPVALLSSHLTFLRTTLPQSTLTNLYRRIVARLSEHILQRQLIYRGQFEQHEARKILAECELWARTCHGALHGGLGGGHERVDGPWRKLIQAAKVAGAEGESFSAIADATFGSLTDEQWETSMIQITGNVEMGRAETMSILKRRSDSSR
ncbi:TIP-1 family-domain-containing protein [Collybia nuda]|uniref:TIP-1 family-domain-containing protein n=1 Tax=Collybia nuda TaxID=64659 RepID=A0A9P5XZ31_9AGAR|nr:TIP-1 family-domain-containing protein [Collybia nuda]